MNNENKKNQENARRMHQERHDYDDLDEDIVFG